MYFLLLERSHGDNVLQIQVNENHILSLNLLSTHFVSGQK